MGRCSIFSLGRGPELGGDVNLDGPEDAVTFSGEDAVDSPCGPLGQSFCNGRDSEVAGRQNWSALGGISAGIGSMLAGPFRSKESGWCLPAGFLAIRRSIRCLDNYVFIATTSPIYVTVGGKKARVARGCEIFCGLGIERMIDTTGKINPDWKFGGGRKEYVWGAGWRRGKRVFEGLR